MMRLLCLLLQLERVVRGGGGSRSFGGEPSENESVCWFPGILLVQVSRRESTWENEVETQRIVE